MSGVACSRCAALARALEGLAFIDARDNRPCWCPDDWWGHEEDTGAEKHDEHSVACLQAREALAAAPTREGAAVSATNDTQEILTEQQLRDRTYSPSVDQLVRTALYYLESCSQQERMVSYWESEARRFAAGWQRTQARCAELAKALEQAIQAYESVECETCGYRFGEEHVCRDCVAYQRTLNELDKALGEAPS